MKKFILAMLFIGSITSSYAIKSTDKTVIGLDEKGAKKDGEKTQIVYSSDPCLDQALFAMNNAFSLANAMIDWCWTVNTTPQGYNDCSQFWIDWRRNVVADIYANMTSCPEEEFSGWQTRQKGL
jgi:hypothetical protein